MMLKTHTVCALIVLSFLFPIMDMSLLSFLAFSLVVLISAVLPDIDSTGLRIFLAHRGVIHSLTFALLITVLIWPILGFTIAFAFFLGYSLHLAGDMMTVSGVPLLWPLQIRPRVGLFRVRSITEYIVFYLLSVFFAIRTIQMLL
mgnify:CR=1 FL=1